MVVGKVSMAKDIGQVIQMAHTTDGRPALVLVNGRERFIAPIDAMFRFVKAEYPKDAWNIRYFALAAAEDYGMVISITRKDLK